MGNLELQQQELEAFEPKAKIMAANAMSQSLSFCFERKYLNNIGVDGNTAFKLKKQASIIGQNEPYWIKIDQIGRPLKDSAEECFTAIQKMLTSCFLPSQIQLLFLVNSIDGVASLFLGIRPLNRGAVTNAFPENLNNFIHGIWPGLQSKEVGYGDLEFVREKMSGKTKRKFRRVVSLTGIPSMESQYKTLYPATIDKLIAGMNEKDFSYLVVADPIAEQQVDAMLYQCRDLNGQAESLKSFNFTESNGKGQNRSFSKAKTISDSVTDGTSHTESVSQEKKDKKYLMAGVLLASCMFPPAAAVVEPLLAVDQGFAELTGVSLLAGFAPSKTKSKSDTTQHSETHQESETNTETTGYSTNQSRSLSQNLVNKHIEAISEHLFYHSKRLETGKAIGCWNVGVYLMGEEDTDVQSASLQLKSILSGQESIFEPIRVHNISDILPPKELTQFEVPQIDIVTANGLFAHPLGSHYTELKTVLTTKELSYLINFPLRSVPGISVIDSVPDFSLNQPKSDDKNVTIDFGHLLYGGSETKIEYRLPIHSLAKHTLLSGINGTGKTNTVQAVLNALSQNDHHIPFLVIEPAKTEYVDWAIEYNKTHKDSPIKIFMPGCKTYKDRKTREAIELPALHLNPFEPVWLSAEQDPNILTHIDRLKSTFATAFPMYDILPVLMEDLIYMLYQSPSTNWIGKDAAPAFGKTYAPTLTAMAALVDGVIEAHGYEKRVSDNMKACLNTRIASLRRGWKKEMLDTLHSTPWEELFGQPCVINLSYVGDDADKSFFMSLILQFLYEYRTAQAECGQIDFNSNDCCHLTVIEEAHRVMQKCDKPEEPQYKSAMMFSNMLSEIRAYGEGMFLVDQVPTRLIPDAIKNTNTKITHRLVSEDDCKAIAESMGITKEQRPIIPKLLVGQCLISTALSTDKHWIKVNKVK